MVKGEGMVWHIRGIIIQADELFLLFFPLLFSMRLSQHTKVKMCHFQIHSTSHSLQGTNVQQQTPN